MAEHLVGGSVSFYRQEPCKINRVTFYNGNAAAQGVTISSGRLSSLETKISLYGAAGISSSFDLGGFPFPDGFTVYPTDATVTSIIIEYEDMPK